MSLSPLVLFTWRIPEGLGLSTGSVGNCPSFSYEQQGLFEPEREDVTDARSAEIDVVDHVRKFLDQTYTHRLRVVAKSRDPMPVDPSCHHPCHIDGHSTIKRGWPCSRVRPAIAVPSALGGR